MRKALSEEWNRLNDLPVILPLNFLSQILRHAIQDFLSFHEEIAFVFLTIQVLQILVDLHLDFLSNTTGFQVLWYVILGLSEKTKLNHKKVKNLQLFPNKCWLSFCLLERRELRGEIFKDLSNFIDGIPEDSTWD